MLDVDIENNLALAGVAQAAALVQQIARKGTANDEYVEASLSSILVTEPETPQQVFGKLSNLSLGYNTLVAQLSDKQATKDTEITRYIASILGLERKLSRKSKAMNELGDRISHVQRQLAHVDFDNPQVITSLTSIYSDIVSPLAPRIQVAGNPDYLSQPATQRKVRALLLAGVRSAVMWRHMGGKRRNILFKRKQILNSAVKALRLIN